jgi:hypothetical protein
VAFVAPAARPTPPSPPVLLLPLLPSSSSSESESGSAAASTVEAESSLSRRRRVRLSRAGGPSCRESAPPTTTYQRAQQTLPRRDEAQHRGHHARSQCAISLRDHSRDCLVLALPRSIRRCRGCSWLEMLTENLSRTRGQCCLVAMRLHQLGEPVCCREQLVSAAAVSILLLSGRLGGGGGGGGGHSEREAEPRARGRGRGQQQRDSVLHVNQRQVSNEHPAARPQAGHSRSTTRNESHMPRALVAATSSPTGAADRALTL